LFLFGVGEEAVGEEVEEVDSEKKEVNFERWGSTSQILDEIFVE
jgi:hypothetical protein